MILDPTLVIPRRGGSDEFVLDLFAHAVRLAVPKKRRTMIGYITIGALDTEQAKTFYDSVLATIGWKQFADYGGYVGYRPNWGREGPDKWGWQTIQRGNAP